MEDRPIDLARLKEMIRKGIEAIPADSTSESAVLVIGDTGVGKSTIMNLLSKSQVFAEDKLFATLDTTVRKVTIDNLFFLLIVDLGKLI